MMGITNITAPPTTAASNCSWGKNEEQGDRKWETRIKTGNNNDQTTTVTQEQGGEEEQGNNESEDQDQMTPMTTEGAQ
jgi:hypothetical protein